MVINITSFFHFLRPAVFPGLTVVLSIDALEALRGARTFSNIYLKHDIYRFFHHNYMGLIAFPPSFHQ